MTTKFYAQSDSPITPAEPPDGEQPPLVIWGPGDPRPTLPIAGWNPGSGNWPETPPSEPPDGFWGAGGPIIDQPIAEPPWGWGNPPPKPDVPASPGWSIKYGWTEATGWFVFAVPTGPVATPSKRK